MDAESSEPGETLRGAPLSRAALWQRGSLAAPLLIFALALGLRLLYLNQIAEMPFVEFPISDAREYDQWAQRIADGDWWGSETFYQAPAYPYLLALIYKVSGHSLWQAHVVQMWMGALSCVLLFFATRSLFGNAAATFAGLLLAVYPPAIYFDGILGKIELGLLLFTALLLLLLRFQRQPRWSTCLWAGSVAALLALTRENALAFALAIPIWMVLRFQTRSWRERAPWLAAFALGLLLVLGSVGLRNAIVGGSFVLTTSQLGTNFYIGNNSEATGLYVPLLPGRNTPTYEASDAANLAEEAVGRPLSPGEVSAYWLERGLEFVRAEPGKFLKLLVAKTLYTWNWFEISDTEDIYVYTDWSWLLRALLPILHFGTLVPLAAAGVVFSRRQWRDTWLLLWLAAVYTAAVVLFLAFARFRFPLVPLLLPFAGYGLACLGRCLWERDWGGAGLPVAAALLAGFFANLDVIDAKSTRAASYTNLAGIMLNQRREDAALPFLESAAELDPENPDLLFHYAVYHFRRGEMAAAEKQLREMLRLREEDVRGHRLLAALLNRSDRRAEAMRHRQRALQLDPDRGVRHAPKENRPQVVPRVATPKKAPDG